jgi:hypothetical protein
MQSLVIRFFGVAIGAVSLVGTAPSALAHTPSGSDSRAAIGVERGAPALPPRELDVATQARLSASPEFADFVARHGTFWAEWDEATSLPRRVLGRGVRLDRAPSDADDARAMALEFLESESALFRGLLSDDFSLVHSILGGRLFYVVFEQVHDGVPVDESRLDFRINTDGILSLFGASDVIPGLSVSTTPVLSAEAAVAAAAAALPPGEGPDGPVVLGEDGVEAVLVVAPPRVSRRGDARLAYRVHVPSLDRAHDFFVHVDAANGAILRLRDETYGVDVVGNSDGRLIRFNPCTTSTLDLLALPNLRVAVRGGNSAFSDATGAFRITNAGSATVTVDADLSGRWVNVNNRSGSDLAFSASNTPGTSLSVRFNPAGSAEFTVAQVNGYYHTNFIHDWMKARLPGAVAIDQQVPCAVNIDSSCNAYYSGGTINFYRQAGGCINTAYDTVVYHEYGHYADARMGGIVDGGLSEGWGDVLAAYATGQPIIGECFFGGASSLIRTADNCRRWPAGECGGEVHCVGETWAGFAWHLRQNLIAALGAGAGVPIAEQDVLNVFFAGSGNIADAVVEVFAQDDDNGDFTDGTPNFAQIQAAAVQHSFPVPAPPTVTSISPDRGPLFSGTEVVLVGTNFGAGNTQITFGGVPATVRSVSGTTRMTVMPPARSVAGSVTVAISTPFGSATTSYLYGNRVEVFFPDSGALYVGETKRIGASGTEASADWILAVSLGTRGSTISGLPFTIGPPVVLANSVDGGDAPLDSFGYGDVSLRVPNRTTLSFRTIYFECAVGVGAGFVNSPPFVATIFPQH